MRIAGKASTRRPNPCFVEALAMQRRVLGKEHPDTLLGMDNLGSLYLGEGRRRNAVSQR